MAVCLYLLWGAWQDFQNKRIKNSYLWIGGILGVISKIVGIVWDKYSIVDWLWALLPGILLLIVAKVTKEKIGLGDGWVVLILGNYLSVIEICYVFQTALLGTIIFFVINLCRKKITRKYELPFLPFLWGSYTFLWGLGYV